MESRAEREAAGDRRHRLERRDAVAEIALGQRTDADGPAGLEKLPHVVRVRVRAVDRGQVPADVEAVEQDAHRPLPVGREAVLDLPLLLLDVHVEPQASPLCLGVDGLDVLHRRGADAVGDGAEGLRPRIERWREAVHLLPVRIHVGGSEAALSGAERLADAAGGVVGLEQDDADAGGGRGVEHDAVEVVVGAGGRVVDVVELADRRHAGVPHLLEGLDREPV